MYVLANNLLTNKVMASNMVPLLSSRQDQSNDIQHDVLKSSQELKEALFFKLTLSYKKVLPHDPVGVARQIHILLDAKKMLNAMVLRCSPAFEDVQI